MNNRIILDKQPINHEWWIAVAKSLLASLRSNEFGSAFVLGATAEAFFIEN